MTVKAIVDGGQIIDERNESNNEKETILSLVEPVLSDKGGTDSGISKTAIYVGSVVALILIIACFTFFAPAKVRQYDGKDYYGEPNTPGFDEQGKAIRKVD